MDLCTTHPIDSVLSVLAPIVGANFTLKSSRDSETEVERYPLIEYVIHKEGKSSYDYSKKVFRVELIIQLDYLLEECSVAEKLTQEELSESMAVQAIQFNLTSKLRRVVQLMIDPSSLGSEFKESDFIWSKYEFRLEQYPESAYFRKKGADELTGAASLFVLSLLDVDNVLCCTLDNQEAVYAMLDPNSVSGRLLKNKIDGN